MIFTIAEILLMTSWWLLKQSARTFIYFAFSPSTQQEEEIRKLRETLEEIKKLEILRNKTNDKGEQAKIDEMATSMMMESCPSLFVNESPK